VQSLIPTAAKMNAKLVARNPKNGFITLYVEYRNSDKFKRIPTGFKIGAKYWDNNSQRIKANGTANVERDNKTLTAHCDTVNAHVRDFHSLNSRWPSCEELGALLEAKATPAASETKVAELIPVTVALSSYIESKKIDWQPLTVKSFQTLLHVVEEYELETGERWALETLSNSAITNWQQWLMKAKNYKNSTLGKQVKKLKQFLKDSAKAKTVDLAKVTPIHQMNVDSPIITLMAKEIAELYRLDLSQNTRLERVRDLFILQCYTGLRYSDVIRLRRVDIQNGFIKLETKKTVETTNTPLFAQAQAILEKYNYDLSVIAISNPKQNQYLKELVALPEVLEAIPTLKRDVKLPEERGIIRKYPIVPLYTVVTTHVARKSFITACLELGQPAHIVKEFSGHKSDNSFKRYVNAAQGQVAAANSLQNAFDNL
jgi:integrase